MKFPIAGCLLLAVANYFWCALRIFSSKTECPVFDIKQDLGESIADEHIFLAYIAIKENEHYNAVSRTHVNLKLQNHVQKQVEEKINTGQEEMD